MNGTSGHLSRGQAAECGRALIRQNHIGPVTLQFGHEGLLGVDSLRFKNQPALVQCVIHQHRFLGRVFDK
jgi:hypothetical protein